MPSKPNSTRTDDYHQFLEFATKECGAELVKLGDIAEIWQGAPIDPENLIAGDPKSESNSPDDVWVIQAKDHNAKKDQWLMAESLSAKLRAEMNVSEHFLVHGDQNIILLMQVDGEPGSSNVFMNFMSDGNPLKNVVVSDQYFVIRINSKYSPLLKNGLSHLLIHMAGFGELLRLLNSKLYLKRAKSLARKNQSKSLSLENVQSIELPILSRDKSQTLDVILQHEPNASIQRIIGILGQEQKSKECILCFTASSEWLEFAYLNHEYSLNKSKSLKTNIKLLTDLMKDRCRPYLIENTNSQNKFTLWLRHYAEAAEHLLTIVKSQKNANQIIALQGWIKALYDRNHPLAVALREFYHSIESDYTPLKNLIRSHCENFHANLRIIAEKTEEEVGGIVMQTVPLHPSALETKAIKALLDYEVGRFKEILRSSDLKGLDIYAFVLIMCVVRDMKLEKIEPVYHLKNWNSILSEFGKRSLHHEKAITLFRAMSNRSNELTFRSCFRFALKCFIQLNGKSFDHLIEQIWNIVEFSLKNDREEYSFSPETMSVMAKISQISVKEKVYIPYPPGLRFADYLPNEDNSHFQFQNSVDAQIFALREVVQHRQSSFHDANPVRYWNAGDDHIDVIIAAPPTNLKTEDYEYRDAEVFCMAMAAKLVEKNVRSLICVSASFLSRGGAFLRTRKDLIYNNSINSIIYLPPGLRSDTNLSHALLLLGRTEGNEGYVTLIDGSECIIQAEDSKQKILDESRLLEIIHAKEHPKKKRVYKLEFAKYDYDFSPALYFDEDAIEIPKDHVVCQLGDIMTRLRDIPKFQPTDRGVALRQKLFPPPENLEFVSFIAEEVSSYDNLKPASGWQKISKDAFIINTILAPKGLATCLFEHKGMDLLLRPDHQAYTVNSDFVDPQWLQLVMSSESFSKRLRGLTLGSGIPRIRHSSLLRMRLAVPPLEQQRVLVKYHLDSLAKSRAKELGLEEIIEKHKKEFLDNMRLKRHTLSQICNEIKSAVANIYDELQIQGGITANQIISKRRLITFEGYLSNIIDKCGDLGKKIDALTEESRFGPLKPLNLKLALKTIDHEYRDETFDLSCDFDSHSFKDQSSGRTLQPIIRIAEEDFQVLYRNIIDNAKRHGFTSRIQGARISIRVSLMQDLNMVEVVFSNNGVPLPEGMNTERFILRGEKAGIAANTGIGGYHIKTIMDHVGGRLQISCSDLEEFTTEVRLLFPYSYDDAL
jgi:restriction endonuclease S subunit